MKVENVKTNFYNNYRYIRHVSDVSNIHYEEPKIKNQKVYASNVAFCGGPALRALVNDYKWFVNCDKTPAIQSFLKINAPKESLESLLRFILSNEDTSFEFIDSIVKQPRLNKSFMNTLVDKLPANTDLLNFYNPQNPYTVAYTKYLDSKVQNSTSVSELLTIRPDWKGEVLLNKHRQLFNNDNLEIGSVPNSIGKENFEALIDYLRQYTDYGYKIKRNINDFSINGKVFKIKNIIDGKSDKNVYEITTDNGEKFIFKIANPAYRGLDSGFSLGACCKVDAYLTANNCRNSAPLRYYNHNSNVAVYDYINHSEVPKMTQFRQFCAMMPDFSDLGVVHNDTVGANNYFLLDESQQVMKNAYDYEYGVAHKELISVDNDHVNYISPFNPMVYKYNSYLPCEMQMFN